jgi:hypothetical protein
MQQIIRAAAENYSDDEENGLSIERPYIFTIPKGIREAVVVVNTDK